MNCRPYPIPTFVGYTPDVGVYEYVLISPTIVHTKLLSKVVHLTDDNGTFSESVDKGRL